MEMRCHWFTRFCVDMICYIHYYSMKMYALPHVYEFLNINETHNARIMASIYCKVNSHTAGIIINTPRIVQTMPIHQCSYSFLFLIAAKKSHQIACLDASSTREPIPFFDVSHIIHWIINAGSWMYFFVFFFVFVLRQLLCHIFTIKLLKETEAWH